MFPFVVHSPVYLNLFLPYIQLLFRSKMIIFSLKSTLYLWENQLVDMTRKFDLMDSLQFVQELFLLLILRMFQC